MQLARFLHTWFWAWVLKINHLVFDIGPFRYYRALYDYDPFYHSPNEEDIEEELAFKAGDIISVSSIKYYCACCF